MDHFCNDPCVVPFESSVEEPTRLRPKKAHYTFPNNPCAPTKTVVFDQENCTAAAEVETVGPYFYKESARTLQIGNDVAGVESKKTEPLQATRPPMTAFEQSLKHLINGECMENASNTPDFILAEYLNACLAAYNVATRARERWYGRRVF